MIEYGKHHYADIKERREYYKSTLGNPPADSGIYNYYLNMLGMAIAPHKKTWFGKKNVYPYSIKTKQEITKILMIVQSDVIFSLDALGGTMLTDKIPGIEGINLIANHRDRLNKIHDIFGTTHIGSTRLDTVLSELFSLKNSATESKIQIDNLLQEVESLKARCAEFEKVSIEEISADDTKNAESKPLMKKSLLKSLLRRK